LTHDLKSLVPDCCTFVHEIIITDAFPNLRITVPHFNDFVNNAANNQSSGWVEIIVEKKYLTVGLFLNLLRLLA